MIEIVYKGSDNPNTVTFKEDGAAIDFSAATRMTLELSGLGVVADSAVDAALMTWALSFDKQGNPINDANGDQYWEVEFNLNDLDIAPDTYRATVKVYDPLHTDGQVVVHMDEIAMDKSLQFVFADVA